jgi:hypothetical protein
MECDFDGVSDNERTFVVRFSMHNWNKVFALIEDFTKAKAYFIEPFFISFVDDAELVGEEDDASSIGVMHTNFVFFDVHIG